jgi:Zn-dependent protease
MDASSTFSWPTLLGVVLAALALLAVFRAIALLQWMGYRWSTPELKPVPPAEVDRPLHPIFQQAVETLAPLGFKPVFAYRSMGFVAGARKPFYGLALSHGASGAWATVGPSTQMEGPAGDIVFFSFLDGDRAVMTPSGTLHAHIAIPSWVEAEDPVLLDPAAQWAHHVEHAARAGLPDPTPKSPADFLAFLRRYGASIVPALRERGALVERAGEAPRLTLRAALSIQRRLASGNRKRAAALKKMGTPPSSPARVAADVHLFETIGGYRELARPPMFGKWALFGLSAVAFAAAFAFLWGWQRMLMLLGWLLFHEFGHYLGMVMTGHRARYVVFLPFLGMAAIGEKEDATPFQRLLVLFMGPLPGVILAGLTALFGAAAKSPIVLEAGMMGLALNLFNLLPITPLDGGQIVEVLLLGPRPRLRAAFTVVSAAAFVVIVVAGGGPVAWLLPALILPGAVQQWQRAAIVREVRDRSGETRDRARLLPALFAALRARQGKRGSGVLVQQQASALLRDLLMVKPARAVAAAGILLYGMSLVVPVGAGLAYFGYLGAVGGGLGGHDPAAVEERVNGAASDGERLDILLETADQLEEERDGYIEQALSLAEGEEADPALTARVYLEIGLRARDGEESKGYLDEAVAVAEKEIPPGDDLRLRVLVCVGLRRDLYDDGLRLGYLEKAIAAMEKPPETLGPWEYLPAAIEVARAREAAGKVAEAEKILQRAVEWASAPGGIPVAVLAARSEWADFHYRTGRADKAAAIIEEQTALASSDAAAAWALPEVEAQAGWYLLGSGDAAKARERFASALARAESMPWRDEAPVRQLLDLAAADLALGDGAKAAQQLKEVRGRSPEWVDSFKKAPPEDFDESYQDAFGLPLKGWRLDRAKKHREMLLGMEVQK